MSFLDRMSEVTKALQGWIVPKLRYSQISFEEQLVGFGSKAARWLDVGCGHHLLVPWHEKEEQALVSKVPVLVGLDYDLPSLEKHRSFNKLVRGNIANLPFADASFDLVTANMVVEHLDDPARQLSEIARVLAPGGVFLFHTPNLYGYPAFASSWLPDRFKIWLASVLEGRAEEDVFQTHYKANKHKDIVRLATAAGLKVDRFLYTASVPVFGRIPPLAFFELLYLRLITSVQSLAFLRQTLIVALRKP